MEVIGLFFVLFAFTSSANGERVKRQSRKDVEADEYYRQHCTGREPGEWFRLEVRDCRDVFQCTDSGLQALRCPHGLAFDLAKQTCDWKNNVKNCDRKEKKRTARPLLRTVEPHCEKTGELACGTGLCLAQDLFCDGKPDCDDDSDENFCDIDSDPNAAPDCNSVECTLPECFCYNKGYTKTPKDMDPELIPQMVMITFDDAVNNVNTDLYDYIFNGERKNPNGCTIKATFFVSHKYTNYTAVQELYRVGHEIAVHSISHNDSETFWTEASKEDWTREMAGGREIIKNMANISDQVIYGVRAPYLRLGGNNQFVMMEQNFFLYDSTIVAPFQATPLWPYMLFYRMPHSCHGFGQKCPTRSFAIWEIVMNELDRREDPTIDQELPGCAMVDSCFSTKPEPERFYKFLVHNFGRHYNRNRAPLGLFFHSAFLKNNPDLLDTFLFWLDETLETNKDVYFVTMTQTLLWIQDPQPLPAMANYDAWQEVCVPQGEPACAKRGENNCQLNTDELPGETIRLATCQPCPNKYPWLNDPLGEGRIGF